MAATRSHGDDPEPLEGAGRDAGDGAGPTGVGAVLVGVAVT
jgi:hypothetical protein